MQDENGLRPWEIGRRRALKTVWNLPGVGALEAQHPARQLAYLSRYRRARNANYHSNRE